MTGDQRIGCGRGGWLCPRQRALPHRHPQGICRVSSKMWIKAKQSDPDPFSVGPVHPDPGRSK